MSIAVVRTLPEEEWRRFVEEQPTGNIFHTPEMFQVFELTEGHRPELWAAIQDGRVLALLLPVRITLMSGVLQSLTMRSVAYGSVLCAPDAEGREALGVLLRTYVEEVDGPPLFTELRSLSDMEAVQPTLQECGFAYEDHLNYLIDLDRPSEDILRSVGSRTRKHIRRGLRRDEVDVEEVKERDGVAACYDLLSQTYRFAEVPLADISLFESAFDVLYPKNMVRFTVARVDQAVAAVSVELLYKDVVYGWYGGLNRDYGSYMSNELLMWNILKWGAESDYKVYDFGGAGKPDEEYGVRDFKAKFGGQLVCYGRNMFVHAPGLLTISRLGYQVYRKLQRIK